MSVPTFLDVVRNPSGHSCAAAGLARLDEGRARRREGSLLGTGEGDDRQIDALDIANRCREREADAVINDAGNEESG